MVVGIVFLATLFLGCIEFPLEDRVVKVNDVSEINCTVTYTTEINPAVYRGITITGCTIITGKPVEIRFSDRQKDMIVFEDGAVIHVHNAEAIVWQLGKVHNITIRDGAITVVDHDVD